MSKYVLTLEWANGDYLELKSKKDTDNSIMIVRTEENGHFKNTRLYIENVCKTYFEKILKEAGDEMES